jgi:hypothetical protein
LRKSAIVLKSGVSRSVSYMQLHIALRFALEATR